jgi:hypothetical protein
MRVRGVFVVLGVVMLVTGAANAAGRPADFATRGDPATGGTFDFAVNWVAGKRLVEGESLYDRAASKRDAEEILGQRGARVGYRGTFSSFIGPPTTALLMVPWIELDFEAAFSSYRVVQLLLILLSVVIVGFALPRPSRLPAILIGIGAVGWSFPIASSLFLNNVDGFILLALSLGIWSASRHRWALSGAATGVATLLKVNPWILTAYLALRINGNARWRVIGGAAGAIVVLIAAAAVVGGPTQIVDWMTDVAPEVSKGAVNIDNQSLPAYVARLVTPNTDLLDSAVALGGYRLISPVILIGGTLLLWWLRRSHPFDVLELGIVILLALLAGPIAWAHYSTWSILVLVLMVDPERYRALRRFEIVIVLGTLAGALALMSLFTTYPKPKVVADDWLQRLASGRETVALMIELAVATWLLHRSSRSVFADI